MLKQEFENSFVRIISQFGSKNYSQDRINLIYDEVKNYSTIDFERVIKLLIGNSRTAPMVSDFRKAVVDLSIKPFFKSVDEVKTHNSLDLNTGWVYPLKKGFWADERAIYIRDEKYPKFILKSQCENEELLDLDREAFKKYVSMFRSLTDCTAKTYNPKEYHRIYGQLLAEY